MNFLYLLPFSYFASTRLKDGSLAFHALFEWGAALLLAAMFGVLGTLNSIFFALGAYLAFISLYEIGYLFNDLVASKKESCPRLRGPQGTQPIWLVSWVVTRIVIFGAITMILDMNSRGDWWLFFTAMMVVFIFHNMLHDNESKSVSFLWLAWFRFLAPVIFIVVPFQRMGIAFGAASLYASFRLFGYLDSKGMLLMPGRQSIKFRSNFFLIPLLSALATWHYEEAAGFRLMVFYFSLIAGIAYFFEVRKAR